MPACSKVLKQRKAFPNDEAILKVLYLVLHQVARKWTMPVQNLETGAQSIVDSVR